MNIDLQDKIFELAKTDPTIAVGVEYYKHHEMSYTEMLEHLVIQLQAERHSCSQRLEKLIIESPPKPLIINPYV